MRTPAAPPRSTTTSGRPSSRALALLVVLAAVLGVALVLGPSALAASAPGGGFSGQSALAAALRPAFVEYWHSGAKAPTPRLAHIVDYWFRYHVVKAVVGALLLTVLLLLGALLRTWFVRPGDLPAGKRPAVAAGGVLVLASALFALLVVMANIQGAVAPLSSTLSNLPLGHPGGELGTAVEQVQQNLAGYSKAGSHPPAITAMVDDFGRYHAVLAYIAAVVIIGLVVLSFASWRQYRREAASDKRARRLSATLGVLTALLAAAILVVMIANIGTADDPEPALLGFFQGGD